MRIRPIPVWLGVFAMSACAPKWTPPQAYVAPPDRSYNTSKDVVWDAVMQTFTDLEIPINNMEKASGFIRSDDMNAAGLSYYLDCGLMQDRMGNAYEPGGDANAVNFLRLTVLVQEDPPGTIVRVREYSQGGSSTRGTYNCSPTGYFGTRYLRALDDRLSSILGPGFSPTGMPSPSPTDFASGRWTATVEQPGFDPYAVTIDVFSIPTNRGVVGTAIYHLPDVCSYELVAETFGDSEMTLFQKSLERTGRKCAEGTRLILRRTGEDLHCYWFADEGELWFDALLKRE